MSESHNQLHCNLYDLGRGINLMYDFLITYYGIIIVITITLILIILCLIIHCNQHYQDKQSESNPRKEKEIIAKQTCITWLRYALIWLLVEYAGIVIPFEINIIVILLSVQPVINPIVIIAYSIASLSFGAAYSCVRPSTHARAYRKAYTYLNRVIITSPQDEDELADAIIHGETEIDKIYDL